MQMYHFLPQETKSDQLVRQADHFIESGTALRQLTSEGLVFPRDFLFGSGH